MSFIPYRDLLAEMAPLADEIDQAVYSVLRRNRFILGPELESFEKEWSTYCGVRHAIGVGSGLSAIEILLKAYGIGPGDEVIVPAYTFIGTWLGVTSVGAIPVAVDVDKRTSNIDPGAAEAAVTNRTAAILLVHLFGCPAPVASLREVAARYGILLLEDACQAHGASVGKKRCGSLADGAAFSFYPTKNLGALGDAGAVTVDSDEIASKVRTLRNYGFGPGNRIIETGTNSRLDEIQAAVLRVKLRHLDANNEIRRKVAFSYLHALEGTDFTVPETPNDAEPVWHIFSIRHPDRDAVRTGLKRHGVETRVYYGEPPHESRIYAQIIKSRKLPITNELAETSLALPCHPAMCDRAPFIVRSLLAITGN